MRGFRTSASFPEKQHYHIGFWGDIVAGVELNILTILKRYLKLPQFVEEVLVRRTRTVLHMVTMVCHYKGKSPVSNVPINQDDFQKHQQRTDAPSMRQGKARVQLKQHR